MQLLGGYGGLVMHIFTILYDKCVNNGIVNIKLYNMVMCGGDGLVMTQNCANCDYFTGFNAKMMVWTLCVT